MIKKILRFLIASLFVGCTGAPAQIAPTVYYQFTNTLNPSVGSTTLTGGGTFFYGNYNTQVGPYIGWNNTASANVMNGQTINTGTRATVQLLLKSKYQTYQNSSSTIFRWGEFQITLRYDRIGFSTPWDYQEVVFNQVNRMSWNYFNDSTWHQFVFVYKGTSKQIWLDGQQIVSLACPSGNVTGTFTLSHPVQYTRSLYDIDEVAIYTDTLSGRQIAQNYFDMLNGQHYTTALAASIIPTQNLIGSIVPNEYTTGTKSAAQQLMSYPLARYKPGNTLMRCFNWIALDYLGGRAVGASPPPWTLPNAQSYLLTRQLDSIFINYFNYGLTNSLEGDGWANAMTSVSNANPNIRLDIVTLRAQVSGGTKIQSQSMPAADYFQNGSGQRLDPNGNISGTGYWRPTAPTADYNSDGQYYLGQLNTWGALLTGRNNPDSIIINEDGEVFPLYDQSSGVLDPQVNAAWTASGMPFPNWLAKQFATNEISSYRNIMLGSVKFNKANWTEYAIDGSDVYRFRWVEARKVNTLIRNQYYSTPDFYVRWSGNWRYWVSAWHGWQWMTNCRYNELAVGDNLYSPFVSAGWDAEDTIVRPAQWLGLLKTSFMMGVDFPYVGYFGALQNDPKTYVWQAASSPYAQAISSRYESYLRSGTLQNGDVPNDYAAQAAGTSVPAYTFYSGDNRILTVVRKLNASNKYVIATNFNNNDNYGYTNTPNSKIAKFVLGTDTMLVNSRRQGSVYFYDKTVTPAVFYQADLWHDSTHYDYWTKDFNFEAELYDNTNKTFQLATTGNTGTNYVNFTTAITYADTATVFDTIKYNFQPRTDSTYYVWIRLRSRTGGSTGAKVMLNGGSVKTISGITTTNWYYYRFQSSTKIKFVHVDSVNNEFGVLASNKFLEFDKFTLTPDSTLLFPEDTTTTPCTPLTATITASGATTFCSIDSVILTANLNNSYLWSTAATTRSITVKTTGTYTVTVSDPSGCTGVSSGTSVTVNPSPSIPIITPNGSTSFCTGGTVTITSSAASGNSWSTGATTQSISVSTTGSYTVTVTSGGCSRTSSAITVTVTAAPSTPTITPSGATTFCSGSNVVLSSSAATSYLWSTAQTTRTITVNSSGTYTVTVSNGSCTATSSGTTVTVNASPTAPVITPSGSTTFCTGGSVTLTSSVATTYLWSTGVTTQAIVPLTSGSYTVTVSNASGCTAVSSGTVVTINPTPTAVITANGPTSICTGQTVNLSANSSNSYLWSTGATTQSINVATTATFTVTVTQSSCTSSGSNPVTVTVSATPTPTISAGGATTFCQGGSVLLTSSPATTYVWSTGATTQSISVSTTGSYIVSVSSVGCNGTSNPTAVTVVPVPVATIVPSGVVNVCSGSSVQLTASAANSYLWSNGATTKTINVSANAGYNVTVTANGCASVPSSFTVVNVISTPSPVITPSGSTTFCQGDSVTLTSTAGDTYSWNNGATTQSIKVKTSGSYVVQLTTSGCIGTSSPVAVAVISRPVPTITYNGSLTPCTGQSVILTSNFLSGNTWSTGATTTAIAVTTTANYGLTVLSNGCTGTTSRQVTFSPCDSTCNAPTNILITNVTYTSAVVNYTGSANATNYIIKLRNVYTGKITTTTIGSQVSAQIKNLTKNTLYCVNIKTLCSNGSQSDYSTPNKYFLTRR